MNSLGGRVDGSLSFSSPCPSCHGKYNALDTLTIPRDLTQDLDLHCGHSLIDGIVALPSSGIRRVLASTMPSDTDGPQQYAGNEAIEQGEPAVQGETRAQGAAIGGSAALGPVMDSTDVTADRDAEGDPRRKRKKAGSADDGDEAGDKGRRPCDMCRKRKVSIYPRFPRRQTTDDECLLYCRSSAHRSKTTRTLLDRRRPDAGDAPTSIFPARTSTSTNDREDQQRRIWKVATSLVDREAEGLRQGRARRDGWERGTRLRDSVKRVNHRIRPIRRNNFRKRHLDIRSKSLRRP